MGILKEPQENYQNFINESVQLRFDNISGEKFKEIVARLYRDNGYPARKLDEDYGCDVIVERNDTSIGIQCKNYKANNWTGNRAVQEANSGKNYYNYDQAMVITTSYYTPDARKQAKSLNVELWDWEQLKLYVINTYYGCKLTT